jgi:predicted amidohydrolase YtcJ
MEHLGLMTEEQIEWASRLKLGLSFNVNILYFYATAFSNFIVGPERTNRWAPSYLASKYGVKWTLHQDHPSHPGPISPFMSMQTAVTRTELGKPNKVYGPEYRVSIHEALKGTVSLTTTSSIMGDCGRFVGPSSSFFRIRDMQ